MSDRSEHGGALPVHEQVLRADVHARLFGPSTPVRIGRFVVERQIGAGGMGTVFAARDEELDRTVAVKVVRSRDARGTDHMRARMLREAKSLAQLSHPNVVAVYEVGEQDDGVFIAMEYVEGPTLRAWLNEETRSTDAVLAKFVAAGRGLSAAHRRQIVHRDFKPDNVLLDREEERPRVADFGLARAGSEAPAEAPLDGANEPVTAEDGGGLTVAGAAVGTPAYMAPEQVRGEVVDAAGDQYSFCVALHEALYGHRPDEPAPATRPVGPVRASVRRAIERGLAEDPAQRWPTMDALLGALAPRGKRRLPWAAAAVAVVGAAAWWLSPDACVRPPAEIWAPARDAAAEQFRDATPAYIGATWPAVSAALDMYETRWRDQSLAACQTSGARSEVERARATDCLDHRKAELAHLVGGLARGAAPALATALSAASSLPAADVCNSDASLSTWQVIDDPRERAQRDEARAWLREARDALALGKTVRGVGDVSAQVERGIEAGRRAQQRAADLGDRATESHARFLLAQLHLIAGDVTAAEAEAHGAATTAERGGDARARIRALSFQAYVVGQNRDRLGEARQLAAQAMAALDAGGGDDLLRAQLLNNLANVAARARPPQFEAALADHREALALLTDAAGLDHPETISAQLNLGATLNRAGQAQEALEQLEAAATRAETLWGREHPRYAKASRILGLAQLRAGRLDAAYQRLSHALAVHERVYGATHPEVANDLYNVALVERRRSRHAEAIALLRRGIEIREAHAGSKHPELIPWLVLEGRSALDLAHDADARDVLDRALRLCELDGAQPLEFAKIRALLARATVRVDAPRAAALAQQARDAYVRAGDYPEQVAKLDALIADAGRVRASP